MYPRMRKEEIAKISFNMIRKSPVKIKSVKWREIAKYLRIKVS